MRANTTTILQLTYALLLQKLNNQGSQSYPFQLFYLLIKEKSLYTQRPVSHKVTDVIYYLGPLQLQNKTSDFHVVLPMFYSTSS